MASKLYTTTAISIEKKTLERLRMISKKSSAKGDAPHRGVSEIVREAIDAYLKAGAGVKKRGAE